VAQLDLRCLRLGHRLQLGHQVGATWPDWRAAASNRSGAESRALRSGCRCAGARASTSARCAQPVSPQPRSLSSRRCHPDWRDSRVTKRERSARHGNTRPKGTERLLAALSRPSPPKFRRRCPTDRPGYDRQHHATIAMQRIHASRALTGVVGPVLFMIVVTIASLVRADYSQIRDPISDLGNGPHAWLQNTNFAVFGCDDARLRRGVLPRHAVDQPSECDRVRSVARLVGNGGSL